MHVSILPQPPALFIWLYQDRLLKKEAGDVVGTFPALRKRVRCFRGTPKVRSRIVLPSVGAKLGHPLRYSAGFVQTFRLLRAVGLPQSGFETLGWCRHSTFVLFGSPVKGSCRHSRLRGCFLPFCCSGIWIVFLAIPPSPLATSPQELRTNSP